MGDLRIDIPLVAIVTPVYNGAAFLEETMACVQAQTYGNVLHVVLDNASTDATPDIIARFRDGRVPLLHRRNAETVPIAENWSRAVALVPSEVKYFQILCADDLLRHDAVERMVAVAESDPSIELVGAAQYRNGRVRPVGLPRGRTVFDGAMVARSFLNKRANDIPHTFGLFRNHGETRRQRYFDLPYSCFDTDACLRALSRGKFGFVHEPLHTFRIHPGQMSATVLRKNRSSVWESLVEIYRWAPKFMSAAEADACARKHLRVVCRYMLAWRIIGRRDQFEQHRERLGQLGIHPAFGDYFMSVAEWPVVALTRRVNVSAQRRRWDAEERRARAA